jgi:tetratricopeptide (TPR) repeat protein
MTHGSTAQKQAVVSLLSRNFRPMFAPALKLALTDEDSSLRVQAATAAANIENQFLETSVALKARLDKTPDDFNVALAMARHYDDYAFSGILDQDQEKENRERAVELYHRCLAIKPDDPQVTTAVGRFLLREDKIEEAGKWVAAAVDKGIDHLTMLNWHLECLYRMGDYDRIRELVGARYDQLARSEAQPQVLKDVVNLWAGYRPGQKLPGEAGYESETGPQPEGAAP